MKILIVNSGSSSIKFQLIDMTDENVLASGIVERIGGPLGDGNNISCTFHPDSEKKNKKGIRQDVADHRSGMLAAIELLGDEENAVMADRSEIGVVGHRIVHGGEKFHAPTIIDDAVLEAIKEVSPLAPLHNPAGLDGIQVAKEIFPEAPHVAVFDTAFYQTIPARAHIYALPYEMYTEHRIRRYGFHGTSHKFVTSEAAQVLNKPASECNLITVHLGNGCSMTAVENGKAIDTTMGLTPLEGLVMGTRSGDIDPAIFTYLHNNADMSVKEIDHMLNKESGLVGLCGISDMRDLHEAVDAGNERAKLALDVQTYKIRKSIGAYMSVLERTDAIVFTAGIGENDEIVRSITCAGLKGFGVKIDEEVNNTRVKSPLRISTDDSTIEVWVIPTNEELAIAREAKALVA